MIDQKSLANDLTAILNDPLRPIVADKFNATKDRDLATGTSGVALALHEFQTSTAHFVDATGFIDDVWSASLTFADGNLVVAGAKTRSESRATDIGDVFTGYSCKCWSRLVFGQEIPLETFSDKPGGVVRPGLGHGELIRDFARWISKPSFPQPSLHTSEESFPGLGWCNGIAGLISVKTCAAVRRGERDQDRLNLIQLTEGALNTKRSILLDLGPSLCHGLPGLLVICAGVARVFQQNDLLQEVFHVADSLLTKELQVSLPTDVYLDASWLTGSAGILWAISAIRRKPNINPLLPYDARIYDAT